MVFSEKWLQNHPEFLLYFLIHIDVVMLCRKFELIPTLIFQVIIILKYAKFLKYMYTLVLLQSIQLSINCLPILYFNLLRIGLNWSAIRVTF